MSHITNRDYQRSITHFVYFCMNYPQKFFEAWNNDQHTKNHLIEKFTNLYDKYGSSAVMIRFFLELDKENQETLMYWIKEHYKGQTI